MPERVTGIGGVFFKAKDPARLSAWYRDRLGIDVEEPGFAVFRWRDADTGEPGATIWSVFPDDSTYLGAPERRAMVNYRVRDLDAMIAQLEAAGATVEEQRHADENGRFVWAVDPEGNRIELWEPPPGP